MAAKLQRSFPSREQFAETFVRRLSDRGIELRLTGQVAPPTGSVLDLDLRLADGTPLIVGTGEVTSGGVHADRFRVRFLELSEATRDGLDRLVLLVAASSDDTPTRHMTPPEPGTDPGTALDSPNSTQSIRALVAEVYGDSRSQASLENSAVLVPPDPTPRGPAGAPGSGSGSAPGTKGARRNASGKRSIFERFQVSPAVIIVAIIAGATGAAVNARFQDLSAFVSDLTSADEDLTQPAMADLAPTNITPSDFSAEASDSGTTGGSDAPDGSPTAVPILETAADGQADGEAPILSGAAGEDGADEATDGAFSGERPANRVRLITWDEYPEETVVTFHGNGPFLADRVLRLRVRGGKPRELIKIRGIDLPFRETLIETSTPELERIRTGFHPQSQVNELHAVLDLTGPKVHLDRIELGPDTLALHLRTVQPDADGADGPGAPNAS